MADKPKKPQKLKARLPRGLADRGPAEISAIRAMVEKIRLQFERYGFEPVETPAIEYTDANSRFGKGEGVFLFNGDWQDAGYDTDLPGKAGFFLFPGADATTPLAAMSAPLTYGIAAEASRAVLPP